MTESYKLRNIYKQSHELDLFTLNFTIDVKL